MSVKMEMDLQRKLDTHFAWCLKTRTLCNHVKCATSRQSERKDTGEYVRVASLSFLIRLQSDFQ